MAAQGQRVKAIDNRPEVEPHLIPVWDAYVSLERDRSFSMGGPGPIPFSAIDRYAERYGISNIAEFDRLRRLIMAMDSEYLKFVDEKAKKEREKKP
jgi:hypothetical protein